MSQNGCKLGLRKLFEALAECKDLRDVNVNDNFINKAIPHLKNFLQSNHANLEYLNISNLNMKKKHCRVISEVLIEAIKDETKLKELTWDYDLNCSTATAQTFLTNFAEIENCPIERLSMIGVFNDRKNRQAVREIFVDRQIEVNLFKPEFSDDESEEHDDSEDESQATDQSSSESEKSDLSDDNDNN